MSYIIIHPLDDDPEIKVDVDSLGPMMMTPMVKASLLTLRSYLVVIVVLAVIQLSGLVL